MWDIFSGVTLTGGHGAMPTHPPIQENADGGERRTNITGCLIYRVTKYRGCKDACVSFSFPVLRTLSQRHVS